MVGSVESKKGGRFALVIGGILLAADAFGLDLVMSPDLAIGVPYALVVVLGLWWTDRSYIITAAIFGSALCLLGFYFSFSSDQLWMGVANRGIAIFVIWMVAVLCLFHKKVKIKKLELQRLNEHIGQICSEGITQRDEYFLYKKILDALLAFTQSRFGVIYGVIQNPEGQPSLEKKAGLTWNPLFEQPAGMSYEKPPNSPEADVYIMTPLLDEVLLTGKPLLMNYVSTDFRAGPLASDHPPMESFLGLPLYHEGRLLGVVAVANRTGGYDESRMKYIVPFLSACAIRIHALNSGQAQLENENALKESHGKLQDMEKDTAQLRLKILEKEARLNQVEEELFKIEKTIKDQEDRIVALAEGQGKGEEEFDRLQENLNRLQEEKAKTEERLRDKDARIEKAEEDRNRTAGALWEKEQRLANVLDDLNLLEKDLQEKTESIGRMEEDLEKKDRFLERLETKMLALESQLQLAKKTLGDREGLLENIEKQIHESRRGNTESGSPKEPERITPEKKEKQKKQIEWDLARQRQDLQKDEDRQVEPPSPGGDYEQKAEEQNGKNRMPEKEPDDEKVKNRFRRYTRELERSNEDLRDFASIASHDLQEPIRKIIGFGMRLKKDCSPYLDDRGKDYLERMERSAHQMQKFVEDLLQYSKVTTASTWRQKVDLKEVISHVLTVLESRIEQTHPIVEVGPLPVIEADRMQMLQLFQNLISNALKFHKKGEPPVVRISHRFLESGGHEIRVEDQGIGFDERQADRIFKPFERLHGRSEYEGTGMGLAICQKIVRRHGGELTAESSPREGATFIVTLATREEK